MNRRRFLKYAGATAAVVGASALGLDYLSSPQPRIPNATFSSISSSLVSSHTSTIESTSSVLPPSTLSDLDDPNSGSPELADELRKLPEFHENTQESKIALQRIATLALQSDAPQVRDAFQLMLRDGTPRQNDFHYSVPNWNTQLWGLFQLAMDNEFTKNDTIALSIAIVDGLFRSMGDDQTRIQLRTDDNAMLKFGREISHWQRELGYSYNLDSYTLEALVCWANRAPGAFVREFYDDASFYYGHGSLGNRNPYNPLEYSVYAFSPKAGKFPREAYLWYTTDPGTRREMWSKFASRVEGKLPAQVDSSVEDFFWFQTNYWDYEPKLSEPVDGVQVSGGALMDVDYEWTRFRKGLRPTGTSNAAMVFMSELINSLGVPSTIAWRNTFTIRKKSDGRDSLGEHGHPFFYDPSTQSWKAYWRQYTKPGGIQEDVSFEEPHHLIIVRPPSFLPRFLYQIVLRPGLTEGNPYYTINGKNLTELAQILSNVPSSDARRWLLPAPEDRL